MGTPLNVFALLDQAASRFGDRGAVYCGERQLCTWRELRDRALRLATSVRQIAGPGVSGERKAGLHHALGNVLERRTHEIDRAFDEYAAALAIDPKHAATVASLECAPGAYNVVDSDPSPQHVFLPAFARAVGAADPPRITEQQALDSFGADQVYFATHLRGASNAKAIRELRFQPRPLEWLRPARK